MLFRSTVAPYNYVEHRAITADRAGRVLEADAGLTVAAAASQAGGENKSAPKRSPKLKQGAARKTS